MYRDNYKSLEQAIENAVKHLKYNRVEMVLDENDILVYVAGNIRRVTSMRCETPNEAERVYDRIAYNFYSNQKDLESLAGDDLKKTLKYNEYLLCSMCWEQKKISHISWKHTPYATLNKEYFRELALYQVIALMGDGIGYTQGNDKRYIGRYGDLFYIDEENYIHLIKVEMVDQGDNSYRYESVDYKLDTDANWIEKQVMYAETTESACIEKEIAKIDSREQSTSDRINKVKKAINSEMFNGRDKELYFDNFMVRKEE